MDQREIGKFIASCRKNRDMTQSELAEKLGVSINAVSKTAVNKRTKPDMLPKKARPIIPSATASMSMSRESLSNP